MVLVKLTQSRPWLWARTKLNFFRLHLLAFTIVPLISSAVFYACNGRFHISFVDSLFLCYSAMTVTGLSTVRLSRITAWQQVILYLLMMVGDITTVSWIMVLVRKEYFKEKCEYVVQRARLSKLLHLRGQGTRTDKSANASSFRSPAQPSTTPRTQTLPATNHVHTFDPDETLRSPNVKITVPTPAATLFAAPPSPRGVVASPSRHSEEPILEDLKNFSSTPESAPLPLHPELPHASAADGGHFLDDIQTFSSSPKAQSHRQTPARSLLAVEFSEASVPVHHGRQLPRRRVTGVPIPNRTVQLLAGPKRRNALRPGEEPELRWQGFGGFPGFNELVKLVYHRIFPASVRQRLEKTFFTLPYIRILDADRTPWLNFPDLIVGRNSDFQTEELDDDQLEQLGGAEYRALRLLSYLVPMYFIVSQLAAFLLFAPYIASTSKYDDVFAAQPRLVNKIWFSVFQVMGTYTGGGLTLVDAGMVPFDDAYLMIFALAFTILAGNHALPIFLRFTIWVLSKMSNMAGTHTSHGATLSFLLAHPRRCFIYLFPAHQTWFLLIVLIVFSVIEWAAFPILNQGLEVYENLPTGPKVVDGLFQGLAVRASGLAIVDISKLAPALLFVYMVFMYIAVYPVAMSIRSTNVYEERSLGVFEEPDEDEDEPDEEMKGLSGRERVNHYLGWHLRKQLSVDIWWLVWAIFLVAIIERKNIMDEEKKWFDLFRVIFELVSAFGGIGLSMGFPGDSYSFSGAMGTLSKLVIMVVMIRGRHRGLPVAVDRAVLLPSEMVPQKSGEVQPEPTEVPNEVTREGKKEV